MKISVLKLIQSIEIEYGSVRNVPENDSRLIELRQLTDTKPFSSRRFTKLNQNYHVAFKIEKPLKLRKINSGVEQIRNLIAAGFSDQEIADKLKSSLSSVKSTISRYKLNQSYYAANKKNYHWKAKSKRTLLKIIREDGFNVTIHSLNSFYHCEHVINTREIKVRASLYD